MTEQQTLATQGDKEHLANIRQYVAFLRAGPPDGIQSHWLPEVEFLLLLIDRQLLWIHTAEARMQSMADSLRADWL